MKTTSGWTIKSAGVLAVLALLLVASPSRAAVINGSFEQWEGQFDGWTEECTPLVFGRVEAWRMVASEGIQFAHFIAESDWPIATSAAAALQQSFAALAGETLSFDYRLDLYAMSVPPASVTASFSVSLMGSGYSETALLAETADWDSLSFPAFPTAGTYTIRFQAQANLGGSMPSQPPYPMAEVHADVDNVRLVPEPSTLVLLGIGAISLLAYAWRRRNA